MSQSFISYDINTQNVNILIDEIKTEIMKKVLDEFNKRVADYYTLNLVEQETFLFNFQKGNKKKNDKKLFYIIIHELILEIKKDSYVGKQIITLEDTVNGVLKLDYDNICGFVNYMIYIIEQIKKKKEEVIYDFSFKDVMPKINVVLNKIKLSKLIDKSNFIKALKICLSNENSKNIIDIKVKCNININVIQLFCLFYKAFFKNLLELSIDLNIYEINRYFSKEINPYSIKENEILKFGNFYKNIILGNLILMKNLTKVRKISLKMYESYQIELNFIMNQYFSRSLDEANEKRNTISQEIKNNYETFQNQFLFFQHILPGLEVEFNEFNINFNSLDPQLFSYINILLVRHDKLANIKMKFFNFDKVNNRKILINSNYYNIYNNIKDNILLSEFFLKSDNANYNNDYKIYYNYINTINDNENVNFLLLKDEVVLNELFPFFNYNLNALLMILENKINDKKSFLNSLNLNFCSSNHDTSDLNLFNNYNNAIICFLYNFLYILKENQKETTLSSLYLLMDDFTDEKKYIILNVQKKIPFYKDSKNLNLNELKLSLLSLNISNISLILPFQNFPTIMLRDLLLDNLSFNDLENLVNALKNNQNLFLKLYTLEVGLNYMIEDFRENIKYLLKDYMRKNIKSFGLKINNFLSFEDIIDIITYIKKNKNSKSSYILKISNQELSPIIETTFFNNQVIEFKNAFKKEKNKRNIIGDINCSENKKIFFNLKMLNQKDINFYLKFIYSFNKVYQRKNNNKKIDKAQKLFENVFYYMGRFRKTTKEIRIEII